MGRKETQQQVTAIVPAYNEAARIGAVLRVLTTYPKFADVIVVDDGSTDGTGSVVKQFPVRYVHQPTNRGKGYCMNVGVSIAKTDVIFFVDADVKGLTHAMIDDIVTPVVSGQFDMFIGMRNRKVYVAHSVMSCVPLLGGERALTRSLWNRVPEYYKHRFRIEAALNFYATYYGNGFSYTIFRGLSQVVKEKKYGLWDGLKQRAGMFLNIFSAQCKLQCADIPRAARNRRLLALLALHSVVGMLVGGLFVAAVYYGPVQFIRFLFADALREDPSTPIVHLLLHFAHIAALQTLLIIGYFILLLHLGTFLVSCKKIMTLWTSK